MKFQGCPEITSRTQTQIYGPHIRCPTRSGEQALATVRSSAGELGRVGHGWGRTPKGVSDGWGLQWAPRRCFPVSRRWPPARPQGLGGPDPGRGGAGERWDRRGRRPEWVAAGTGVWVSANGRREQRLRYQEGPGHLAPWDRRQKKACPDWTLSTTSFSSWENLSIWRYSRDCVDWESFLHRA